MTSDAVIACNRFGLGAKSGELERVGKDPRGWLADQVRQGAERPTLIDELPSTQRVLVEVDQFRREQRQRASMADDNDRAPAPDVVKKYGRVVREKYLDQTRVRYQVAAAAERPFAERLVHFWSNHFAISADKQPMPALAGLYENEAIRPHVTGNFADLLLAVEQHPAMIIYLDNQRSIGPNSTLGERAGRRHNGRSLGLNENLAREILELHTLGVDGGYTQQDVTTLAKVITGWSIGGQGDRGRFAEGTPGTFEFRDNIHEPGAKKVLGKRYKPNGLGQGVAVLRDLAVHPSTARHVATKLAVHFAGDEPPASLIDRLTNAYLEHDGELAPVYRTLINSDEPWRAVTTKYKSPHDFVVSTLRAFDHVPEDSRFVVNALDLMGQAPWRPGSPAGWPDTAGEWGGADALYKRIEWSNTVARLVGDRRDPVELGNAVLGGGFSSHSRTWVGRAESRQQGVALLLASPDFQRR